MLLCRLHFVLKIQLADRIGTGGRLCILRQQTEKSDLFIPHCENGIFSVILHRGFSCHHRTAVPVYIGRQDGELRFCRIGKQLIQAVIILVIARRHQIIVRRVHQIDGRASFIQRHQRESLGSVPGIHQQRVFRFLFQRGRFGHSHTAAFGRLESAVDIIGMVDHHLVGIGCFLHRFGGNFRIFCTFGLPGVLCFFRFFFRFFFHNDFLLIL